MITCCKNCPDRKLGCHDECDRYISETIKQYEINKEKARRTRLAYGYGDYTNLNIRKKNKT